MERKPQFLQALRAMKMVCVLLIVTPIPAACDLSTDEELVKGDTHLNAYDTFHVDINLTVELKNDLDILLPIEMYHEQENKKTSWLEKRNVIDNQHSLWPNATIHYQIGSNIIKLADVIKAAIHHWETYTCIKFVEEKAPKRVEFSFGSCCCSNVGYKDRVQHIYVHNGCLSKKVAIHEIGHAVGYYHEHARPDRDSYIRVDKHNREGYEKMNYGVKTTGQPYDYLSVMHYYAFITTLDPAYEKLIGRGPGLSFGDIKQTNMIYQCAKLRANCPQKDCPFNGFVFYKEFGGQPACECFCDSGKRQDPIVPCSSIQKEVPGPNIQAASSLSLGDRSKCFDLRPDCESLKAKGLCLMETTKMMEQCTESCGFCGKGTDLCIDHDPACKLMAASCTDGKLKGIINKLCKKTCKLCTKKTTPCDIQFALSESKVSSGQAAPMSMFPVLHLVVAFGLQYQ